jgi:DNA polymerase I
VKVVFDIETNGINPTKIWLIVCRELDNDSLHVFRRISDDPQALQDFKDFARDVKFWIGHNCIDYDIPVIRDLISFNIPLDRTVDTLVVSKLMDFDRDSHSIESYGEEFNEPKLEFSDFSRYAESMVEYCIRDISICTRIYRKACGLQYVKYWKPALATEQHAARFCRSMRDNGFGFHSVGCDKLLRKVTVELGELDHKISEEFPPRLELIREITPERTQHGTLHRKDFRWVPNGDLSLFNGETFCRCALVPFNPDSHKQRIDVLNSAGWSPTDKTKTHIERERRAHRGESDFPDSLKTYGWKINDTNLNTLPDSAPKSARTLAKRIMVEARRRTLTEWSGLVTDDGRIHGTFLSIGAWTQRMSHQKPNMANIANSEDLNGKPKYLGAELRSLFIAKLGSLLVGVDADSIQLRIFAHYLNDKELIDAIVNGNKSNQTDPHSVNRRVLGRHCKTRQAAKRFLYALFLGAGILKLASILECSIPDAQEALDRLMERYRAWERLKAQRIQKDAQRGFFEGLDGRRVKVSGGTVSARRHLMMSGYLQNGEAVVMKLATIKWLDYLSAMDLPPWRLVNLVHDEWQTEVDTKDWGIAREIAEVQCFSLTEVGKELKLNCPLKGTYGDNHDDINTWTIGRNWKVTH